MMAKSLAAVKSEELVQLFTRLAIDKGQAVMGDNTAKATRLYWRMNAVEEELKSRPGDDRRLLAPLYNHRDPSVRLEAANATLAILPLRARQTLQYICDWKEHPFTLDAGMTLRGLESGAYKPT